MSKNNGINQMTPNQIRERGKELLRLAIKKEADLKNQELIKIGHVFRREIKAGWTSPWPVLAQELDSILGFTPGAPNWCLEALGVQGGVEAPLADEII